MDKRGQFFLIASVVVIGLLSGIQTQLGSYSSANTAFGAQLNEMYIFNDITEQLNRSAKDPMCGPLGFRPIGDSNMLEIGNASQKAAAARGILANITYTNMCPRPVIAILTVKSDRAEISGTLTLG